MSRNFGIGQRDMGRAGRAILGRTASRGEMSFSSAATLSDRWSVFSQWAKSQGIGRMERVSGDVVRSYGQELAAKVREGQMRPSTAQNYVSAVNRVMTEASKGRWESVSPTKACGIEKRCAVRESAPAALDRERYSQALELARACAGDRAASVVELARELGLRTKEASLLDAKAAQQEARETGAIWVCDGTKGGRDREVPITSQAQLDALERAAQAQADARAVMPPDVNWKEWREGDLREARESVQECTGESLRDLRSAYACERYEQLTGRPAPCTGAAIEDRDLDRAARLAIAQELGHNRIEVTSEYLGGRK